MLQELQAFPRDRTVEAKFSRLNAELSDRRGRSFLHHLPRLEYLAAAVGVLALALLAHPSGGALIVVAIIAAVVLPWASYHTRHHPSWVLIVFALIEAVAASSFVGQSGLEDKGGAIIRYLLGFLFVAPLLPAMWRSGILRKGGFRDYAIYLIWALVSVSWSILPAVSFARVIAAALPFCAFCAMAAQVRSGEDARRVMGFLLAGCGIVVAAQFVTLVIPTITTWQPDPDTGMLRFCGFFTEPNEIGALMLATLGAGFVYWPLASRSQKVLAAAAMIGSVVQGVMADSRSPFVAMAIGCAVYVVLNYRIKGILAVAAAFVILYCAAALAVPGLRAYLDRGDVASFTGRQEAWDFAFRSLKQSPLLGYGYEVEGQILRSQYFTGWDDVWSMGYQTSLHDGYLSRAVSLGVPALLLWVFITLRAALSCFFRNRDPWRIWSFAPLALLPVLILNFTESVVDFRAFTGILMGLAWAMLECERIFAVEQAAAHAKATEEARSPIVRALQTGHAR
jgi:hypothetical protein